MNEHGDILPYTPMIQIFNLRWYIQHLMDESEEENQNPVNHENWMKQPNWKFMKYVIHHRHPMAPEQLKQKPFEEIFKKHENLDTEKGESNEEEENLLHPQNTQNKIQSLTHLLKMKKRQILQKHIKFIMNRIIQYMMKKVHQKMKMIHQEKKM